ncbi:PHAX protein, partial [Atractosteus spatula]|nr:PHAX protein [Atractosteus spatula]
MAVSADRMEDLEDGELCSSNSDSEMGVAADEQMQKLQPPALDSQAFQSRAEPRQAPTSVTSYRSTAGLDSSDNSESDSDEERAIWKRKRQKCAHPPPVKLPVPSPLAPQKPPSCKVNNIWGAVVQEQSQEVVAAELGILGMEGGISMSSRQSETYNFLLARKMMERERQQQESEEAAKLDEELEDYMQHDKKEHKAEEGNGGAHLKRKRPVKERLGEKEEMDYKGRFELTEDDPEDRVADEIAHRLREPKKDLIERVVNIIGKKKAIELLAETAEVEQNGGIFTIDGSRRRTPGGVYLNLLKNTPSISSDQVKEIFYDENQKEYACKKAAKKRRRHVLGKKMKQAIKTLNLQEHDDASRETFASDTNEALASLDDSHEGHAEPTLDTEEAVVIYNSNDLEIF